MTPTLHVHFALLWPLEPEIVRERLSAWRDGGSLGGWQDSGFRLERPPHVDAPSVVIEGEYEEGCLSGTISMHGERSDWASHVERFLEESAQIVRSLADALGLTASEDEIGAVIADPTLEGAEIASPVSLCAAPERDRVRFTLPGPWRARSDRSRSEIAVTSGGIVLAGDWHRESIGWDRLGGATLAAHGEACYLLLFDPAGLALARLGCAGGPDDDWLALYLDAQIMRRRPPIEAREREARERARALALLGDVQRPR